MWSLDIVTGLDIVTPCPAPGPIMQQIDETKGKPITSCLERTQLAYCEIRRTVWSSPDSTYLKVQSSQFLEENIFSRDG